jgi:chorismate mutase
MDLNTLRADIDAIDNEIVAFVARRLDVCRKVALVKSQVGTPMMQPGRVKEVKERCAEIGRERGLRPEFVSQLYDLIIGETCAMEDRLMQEYDSRVNRCAAS